MLARRKNVSRSGHEMQKAHLRWKILIYFPEKIVKGNGKTELEISEEFRSLTLQILQFAK